MASLTVEKPRRVSPRSGERKCNLFLPATCASAKTLLRPQTCELSALADSECAAADCKKMSEKALPFSTSSDAIDRRFPVDGVFDCYSCSPPQAPRSSLA